MLKKDTKKEKKKVHQKTQEKRRIFFLKESNTGTCIKIKSDMKVCRIVDLKYQCHMYLVHTPVPSQEIVHASKRVKVHNLKVPMITYRCKCDTEWECNLFLYMLQLLCISFKVHFFLP